MIEENRPDHGERPANGAEKRADAKPDPDAYDPMASDQDTAGSMGVSSEWEGKAGPGQHGTSGTRDVSPHERATTENLPPEQYEGAGELKAQGIDPKAGYPSLDPDSKRKPWKAAGKRKKKP